MLHLDFALLTDYKRSQNWDAQMRVVTAIEDSDPQNRAEGFLETRIDLSRFPDSAAVDPEPFTSYPKIAPQADITLLGLQPELDFETIRRLADQTDSTCMFGRDSGRESALA